MARETGCKNIFFGKFFSINNLARNKNNTSTSNGSLGKYKFNPRSGKNSFNCTDKGTKNIMTNRIFSSETKARNTKIRAIGSKLYI